ncbi:MAG: hypothetical protein R6U32_07565 [Candidatus Woesearchaeota archaeon]
MMKWKNMILGIVIASLLAALVVLAGCKTEGVNGDAVAEPEEKCVKREAYTVRVPYNDTEYEVVEYCMDSREYCKETSYTDFNLDLKRVGNTCVMVVENTGDVEGEWKLHGRFVTTSAGGGPCSDPVVKTISPGETERFEFEYEGDDALLRCEKSCEEDEVPTVKDCPCYTTGEKRVPKLVTKYRNETRYRNVTVDCDEV